MLDPWEFRSDQGDYLPHPRYGRDDEDNMGEEGDCPPVGFK
jgi:hypothetical protein